MQVNYTCFNAVCYSLLDGNCHKRVFGLGYRHLVIHATHDIES